MRWTEYRLLERESMPAENNNIDALPLDRWLSVEEIALHLGIKNDTVYKWVTRRKIPGHKVGRLWKFQRAEVDAWVRAGSAADHQLDQSIQRNLPELGKHYV